MKQKLNWSYLEFYSGIGGWSYALEQAVVELNELHHSSLEITVERKAAFDHSDLCNHVLQYNNHTSSRSTSHTKSIEHLTEQSFIELSATIWVMSPPCQPHTRQHSNQKQDLNDPRSHSFLHLCRMLSLLEEAVLPRIVLLENVIGFEQV